MSIVSWLKRRRLDEDDFQEEIRSHLAIAADERMADGADRQTAQLGLAEGIRQRDADHEAARRVWIPCGSTPCTICWATSATRSVR